MSRQRGASGNGRNDDRRRILLWAPDDEEDLELEPPAADPVAAAAPTPVKTPRTNGLGLSGAAPRGVRTSTAPRSTPADADHDDSGEPATRKRGRPKGRAVRRQVHFHVDPQEEALLLAAVSQYGSQQKGLIAALASLQEAELLHDEIARLRDECERQQRLLEEAQALFRR